AQGRLENRGWEIKETMNVMEEASLRASSSQRLLVSAKISSLPTDDLVVLDAANHQLHILTAKDGQGTNNKETITKNTVVSLDTTGAPVAVLPLRLNADALNDLIILREGSTAVSVAMTAAAMTFTVTNTGDNGGVNPAPGAGTGTLRQAIVDANANPGADMIVFSIPGASPFTISPTSALPTITDPLTIDGTTQPGFGGSPIIELNGTVAGGAANGLNITAGRSTVRGMVINRFGQNGILLAESSDLIEGNF